MTDQLVAVIRAVGSYLISEERESPSLTMATRVWLLLLSLWVASGSKVSVNFYGKMLCWFTPNVAVPSSVHDRCLAPCR